MRILITGGAGFIGSYLAEALIDAGNEVFIIDDLSTGSIENIEHLKAKKNFHYTIDTISNRPVLAELIDRCDMIFHLAAAVGVQLIVGSPVRTIETNIKGTEIVLEIANKKKKKVIFTSTSEIYGKSPKALFREDDDMVLGSTHKSRWSYACSKAIDEFLLFAYWKEKKLPVVIVRLFNTVGPRQTGQYGMVIPRFVEQALNNKPITVYGDGKQTRSFTYISDVIRALIDLSNHPKAVGEIFNVGNPNEITIETLAKKIKKMTASKSKIIYLSYSKAYEKGFEDMRRRVPDISKIQKLVGFKPRIQLDEMLGKIIDYNRKKYFLKEKK